MIFGEVDAALSIWDRISKWWCKETKPATESVASRLVRLLESHGVHRNQIPRFIGHSLTLHDVRDDASFLAALDEPILDAVCDRLAVRREWLDCADAQVYPCHDFYKEPEAFNTFINDLLAAGGQGLRGVLIAPTDGGKWAQALLILQETVAYIGNKSICRYHLCNNWVYGYWKSRAYLTACIAIARKHKVYVHGILKPASEIDRLRGGEALLGWSGEGIWALGHLQWYPEDMALEPDLFLKGVDPGENQYGLRSAIDLWLELDADHYMCTGLKSDARARFQAELVKHALPVN